MIGKDEVEGEGEGGRSVRLEGGGGKRRDELKIKGVSEVRLK